MSDPADARRRKILLGAITLPALPVANAALLTPPASEGPFYPTTAMRHDDSDNDLVKIDGMVQQAGGEIVRLAGRVLDQRGQPLAGARVEIWQCDVTGRYLHRGDWGLSRRDPGFQGFGHAISDNDGRYEFRTIKPVPYSGRTPHIHLKVWRGRSEVLTTQLYLPDHPDNAGDWLYQRIPPQERQRVTMFFDQSASEPVAIVDLVV
jgi:protocatechuate 3,4-dioxygenase beta subunit